MQRLLTVVKPESSGRSPASSSSHVSVLDLAQLAQIDHYKTRGEATAWEGGSDKHNLGLYRRLFINSKRKANKSVKGRIAAILGALDSAEPDEEFEVSTEWWRTDKIEREREWSVR